MYTRTCARSFIFLATTDGCFLPRIERMSVLWHGWKQNKNQINPLERMEGDALAAMLPPWSYKSELLTPNPKAYHHLPCRRSPSSPRR